ncbi:MAG: hypothetical protein OQK24_05585 [Magnetovibrio sp.]|nr:hypothetical protein [Magnetovibrio sp.]
MVNKMSIDPQEVIAFKSALARMPVEVIAKHLDDNVILRTWKRNLAEAEIARRTQTQNSSQLAIRLTSSNRHQTAETLSWFVTAFMIACALAIVAGMATRFLHT